MNWIGYLRAVRADKREEDEARSRLGPPDCIGCPVDKVARKAHVCRVCGGAIEPGTHYVQDDHWAPFGNGARYCLPCAVKVQDEWTAYHERLKGHADVP
jgi:hypothetical protein